MVYADVVHVVDDEAPVRRSLERLFRASGMEVHTYASAEEFLAAADAFAGGCVMLDHQMPGLTGLELQRILARRGTNWQVVFLTGHAEFVDSDEALAAGAVAVLLKPAPREALLEAIARARARCQAFAASGPPPQDSSPAP